MRKLLIIVMLGFAVNVNPNSNNSLKVAQFDYQELPSLSRIMEILKRVESKNTPNAISPRGNYIGVLQISKSCVKEVNTHYGTSYRHRDALSVVISEDIFMKVMKRGIALFKSKYNKQPTEEQIVRMWNGGIYSGYKKPTTKKYYAKYLKKKYKYEQKII